jgi:ATP-dependent protease ClpP protease subunit
MKILQLLRDNAGRQKQPVNLVRNAGEATLYIYDVISADWGVGAMAVIDAIAQAGDAKTLNVHINSPGGDVFEGRAIMAALRRFEGKKVAHIDSLCASAATSIALACDEVVMAEGAFFMIHNSMTLGFGNKNDLRETADTLDKIDGAIANDYTAKTGKDAEQVQAWMNAETWFTAAEAKEHGFVDSVTKADKKAKNTWNLAAFGNAPEALKEPPPDPDPKPTPQIEEEPASAGFFMSAANTNRLRLLQVV